MGLFCTTRMIFFALFFFFIAITLKKRKKKCMHLYKHNFYNDINKGLFQKPLNDALIMAKTIKTVH